MATLGLLMWANIILCILRLWVSFDSESRGWGQPFWARTGVSGVGQAGGGVALLLCVGVDSAHVCANVYRYTTCLTTVSAQVAIVYVWFGFPLHGFVAIAGRQPRSDTRKPGALRDLSHPLHDVSRNFCLWCWLVFELMHISQQHNQNFDIFYFSQIPKKKKTPQILEIFRTFFEDVSGRKSWNLLPPQKVVSPLLPSFFEPWQ